MILVNPLVADRWVHNQFPGIQTGSFEESQTKPEHAGFTSLAVGDLDNDGADDIIVALNPGSCTSLGQEPPINTVDVWMNPGGTLSEDDSLWGTPADIALSRNVPLSIFPRSGSEITDVTLSDVEGDGDLDRGSGKQRHHQQPELVPESIHPTSAPWPRRTRRVDRGHDLLRQ